MIINFVYQRGVAAQYDRDSVMMQITGHDPLVITWKEAQRARRILNTMVTQGTADWSMYGYGLRGDHDTANARLAAFLDTLKQEVEHER